MDKQLGGKLKGTFGDQKKTPMRKYTPEDLLCSVCFGKFANKNSRNRHILNIHVARQTAFQCPVEKCHEVFGDQASLRSHVETHNNDNPIMTPRCKVCKLPFAYDLQTRLVRHFHVYHFNDAFQIPVGRDAYEALVPHQMDSNPLPFNITSLLTTSPDASLIQPFPSNSIDSSLLNFNSPCRLLTPTLSTSSSTPEPVQFENQSPHVGQSQNAILQSTNNEMMRLLLNNFFPTMLTPLFGSQVLSNPLETRTKCNYSTNGNLLPAYFSTTSSPFETTHTSISSSDGLETPDAAAVTPSTALEGQWTTDQLFNFIQNMNTSSSSS